MKKNYILSGLLAIQIIASYVVFTSSDDLQSHDGIHKLFEFDSVGVDEILIEDNDENISVLKREGETWVTSEEFPADNERITRLLERLGEVDHGLPIASSPSALKRFEVSKDSFQRRLKLMSRGNTDIEFYLGSGAGARRSHVRLLEQDKIYAATIGSYDLPADIAQWQNKELIQIEIDEIHSVDLSDLSITRSPKLVNDGEANEIEPAQDVTSWIPEGLADDEIFKLEEFESQLRNLATLRYDRAFKGSIIDSDIQAEFTVSYRDLSRNYKFAKAPKGDSFWLKVSDLDELLELNQYNGSRIIENLSSTNLVEKTLKDDTSAEKEEQEIDDTSPLVPQEVGE